MVMRPHTKSQLKPGIFFSPGFYMSYWEQVILGQFAEDTIASNVKFKQHREARIGAILAAAQSKGTRQQHFVGLPNDEPSDVDIVKLEEITMPSGRVGHALQRLNFQLTRCDLSARETILGQIVKKNKPAYEGIILAVDVTGRQDPSNFSEIHEALIYEDRIFPSEIVAIELVQIADGLVVPEGTYGITGLYPKIGGTLINRFDPEAFFFEPAVFTKTRKAVSLDWEDKGSFELMPPIL